MNLAVAAAFLAALLSLVNVLITARLASQGRLQQWRREEMRAVAARIVTLSREAGQAWRSQSERLQYGDDQAWKESWSQIPREEADPLKAGLATLDKLLSEVGQLDLLSSRPARDAAMQLYASHAMLSFALWLASRPRPDMEISQIRQKFPITPQRLGRLEDDFIARARADLGFAGGNRRLRWRRREMLDLDEIPPPSDRNPSSAAGGGESGDDPSGGCPRVIT